METTILNQLYNQATGHEPGSIIELPSSGSNRRYFRINGEQSMVGALGTCVEENRAFLYLAKHFKEKGLPVPEVYACADDEMAYVQQDLGDTLLFNAIEKGRATSVFSEEERQLLIKTIRLLPDIQFAGAVGLDFNVCYPLPEFDARTILWDLNYFKYCFLKATGMEFLEDRLEDDFQAMVEVFDKRRAKLLDLIAGIDGVEAVEPDGAFYVMLVVGGLYGKRYQGKALTNSIEFADALLDAEKVATVPGVSFGADDCLRLSYSLSEEDIEKGLARIKKFVSNLE